MPRIHIRNVSDETVSLLRQISEETGAGIGQIIDFCVAAEAEAARTHFRSEEETPEDAYHEIIQELKSQMADVESLLVQVQKVMGGDLQHLAQFNVADSNSEMEEPDQAVVGLDSCLL